ncbi:hypothetical protein SISNIDRAFT_480599 [Sistotremastrum niveocremeum HHB9708]|uniref:Uncharacterized protein n=2 Tax=Sistotremastraceae TaxID=3402574 RepID=A0A165AHQ4_9AGAM|nr:hypothetical protein SISNIDRAFT_480599 [Sistotremastrum niveocremeum HHB9708]KZT44102.1 hypothetical protein SISSUDRAFT_1057098 [Sistotremastrum suecicum HHB10207 ss-3]
MGSSSSKAKLQLPKSPSNRPSWAGARKEDFNNVHPTARRPIPQASETKNEDIMNDSKDPHLLSNLSRLGAVYVPPKELSTRPSEQRTRSFLTRKESEQEAVSGVPIRNRLQARVLAELLNERKSVTSHAELLALAERYSMDADVLERLSVYVNTPSVSENQTIRLVGKDGDDRILMKAIWREPPISAVASA